MDFEGLKKRESTVELLLNELGGSLKKTNS